MYFKRLLLWSLAAAVCVFGDTIIDPHQLVTVKTLPHTSGFYYQPVNKMQFVEGIWTFVIEMDHKPIYMNLDMLYNETYAFIDFIDKSEETVGNCSSKKIVQTELNTFVLQQIVALVKKHNDLDSKIPKSGEYADHPALTLTNKNLKNRRKRGLINGMGTMYKFLFGMMDHNDANLLHKVANGENSLNNQVKRLTDEMITLASYVEHLNCVEQHKTDLCVYLDAKLNLFQTQLYEIENLYTRLDRAVDDALNNKINDMIMTPKRLLQEMINVSTHLPAKMKWPVELKLKNMHSLLNNDILKIHVFITKERKLLFILEIPLIGQENYNLYQVVPIPFCNNGKCAIIVPDSKYLALSADRRNYVRLDDEETKLFKTNGNNLLCYKPRISHDSDKAVLCDIKILLDIESGGGVNDLAKYCDVRIGKFDTEIFYPIAYYNQWLYVLQENVRLVFDCDSDAVIGQLSLNAGVGILTGHDVPYNCKLTTHRVSLSLMQLKTNQISVFTLPVSTSFNLSSTLQDLDNFEVQSFLSNSNLDHKNLNGMTERLIDLRKRMENNTMFKGTDIEQASNTDEGWFCWFVSFFGIKCHVAESIIATIVLLIMCLIVFRVYRCLCPGLCSELCSCCKRDDSTVVRVNNRMQFVDKKRTQSSDKYPSVGYHVEDEEDSKVFIKKF
ncbi:F protein [Buzura suppressaria nucleopolyhedrovirus]|uniref:F protein n=1 Tax=Buzura suppressaria nuclear polyhedrosis virus TaxID=74320 RepID=W5VLE4_NPVBS|nr:F protein [Buzura suppressaria nucleopolyhedrovirus]AHH82709.1 F protein [Buzura suppressaria nucleopolyhedrovirus]QYF10656.1 fusion protein [Buzura suppressaria nucleopolyhedrovirus]